MTRVCFVCLGNICRSPMAEAVLRAKLSQAGLGDRVVVRSAGTGDWHVGAAADERASRAMAARGFDLTAHRARQFVAEDFADYDLVVALDRTNARDLRRIAPPGEAAKVVLLMSYVGEPDSDVPDPYYGDAENYERAADLIERGCDGLLEHLRDRER